MKLKILLEDYDENHICRTPGAIYSISFHDNTVNATVKLPKNVSILEKEMDDLEVELHYALEGILAKFFNNSY